MELQKFLQLLIEGPSKFDSLKLEDKIDKLRFAFKNAKFGEYSKAKDPETLFHLLGVGQHYYNDKIKPHIEEWGLEKEYKEFNVIK